jgi:hypothetical protein
MKKSIPERLLEALQIIEGLRRSLQDIGRYTIIHGEEKGQRVLWAYTGPHLYRRLTHAREQVEAALLAVAPEREEELIALLDDDERLQVWSGPTIAPPVLSRDAADLVSCMARHIDTFDRDLRDRAAVQEAMGGCANELAADAAAQDQNKPGSGQALLTSWCATLRHWLDNGALRADLSANLSAQTGYEWSAPDDREKILLAALRDLHGRLSSTLLG